MQQTLEWLLEAFLFSAEGECLWSLAKQAYGILFAALWTGKVVPTSPPFEQALEEGKTVGLDLSREEREFHQVRQGLVLLFHS